MRQNLGLPAALLCIGLALGPARADTHLITALSEAALRGLVVFGPDDQLKLAECEDAQFITCTHIWGPADADDAARVALGGKPSGHRITVIAAESARASDFDRVIAHYSEIVSIEAFGPQAVWSEGNGQLSLRDEDGFILHVNVAGLDNIDLSGLAIAVAQQVLSQR